MKKTIIYGLIVAGLLGLAGCPSSSSNTNTSTTTRPSNSNSVMTSSPSTPVTSTAVNSANNNSVAVVQDNFYINAAQGGLAEVALAKLALQKSQNADVKKFAQMMVTDHEKANTELKMLADKKSVKLPAEPNSSQKSAMDDLNKLSGADFDKKYVETMVKDHETTVALFEDNAKNSDADIKAFAAKTLPTLKSHLEMINTIQSKMK